MNVVLDAAHRQGGHPVLSSDAREVGEQAGQDLGREELPPVFRAEDAVHERVAVGVGHDGIFSLFSRPYGTGFKRTPAPQR